MITVVNMIPFSLSGESNQDSEPNLAVNPAKPTDMVGTAFTPAPAGGAFAPIYVSTNGGTTWSLRNVVPGAGFAGTGDITVGFATKGGTLYAGTLNGSTGRLNILRTSSFTGVAPMKLLVDRDGEDQPWVVAGSVVVGGTSRDRVYVGNNDFNQPSGNTGTVDLSLNARTAAAPAGFAPHSVERRTTLGQDGPRPQRPPLRRDGLRGPPALGERVGHEHHHGHRRHARRQLGRGRRSVPVHSSTPATARSASGSRPAASSSGTRSWARSVSAATSRSQSIRRTRARSTSPGATASAGRPGRTGRFTFAARRTAARHGRTTSGRSRTRRTRASPSTAAAASASSARSSGTSAG